MGCREFCRKNPQWVFETCPDVYLGAQEMSCLEHMGISQKPTMKNLATRWQNEQKIRLTTIVEGKMSENTDRSYSSR